MHRRVVTDADEHQWRREARRTERAHGHPVITPLLIARREDRNAAREAAECGAKRVGINHCAERRARRVERGVGSRKSDSI